MPNFDLSVLDPPPAGFGHCRRCPYLNNDSAAICYACSLESMEGLAPPASRCSTCDLPYGPNEFECKNPTCAMSDSNRSFDWNYAVTMRSGTMKQLVNRYKFEDQRGWGVIFSRVLVGFLDAKASVFSGFDIIIPSPTFIGRGGRPWDHTRSILEAADQLDSRWPFWVDEPLIKKTAPTPSMSRLRHYRDRKEMAETELRDALNVPDPAAVSGLRVVVFDDVFTDGLTLREIARALRDEGAERVCGVTLVRQPFG